MEALFTGLLGQTRAPEGNEGVTIHTDQDDPTTIIPIEHWASREHYVTYNKWRAERGDLDTLAELLEQPPRRRFFDQILAIENHPGLNERATEL
jgi:quinol monooxygenase YgiN